MVGKGKEKRKKEKIKKAQPKRPPNSPYNLPFFWIGRSEADPLLSLCDTFNRVSDTYPNKYPIYVSFIFLRILLRYVSAAYRYPICIRYVIRTSSGVSG